MSVDTAWAAGLFEGEGCIHLRANGRGVVLSLAMTDADVVRRFARVVGVGSVTTLKPPRAGCQVPYRWTSGRAADVLTVMGALGPFFGERRAKKAGDAIDRAHEMIRNPRVGRYTGKGGRA